MNGFRARSAAVITGATRGGMIHLDTNFLTQATVAGSLAHGPITAGASAQENFNVNSIAWAEFLCRPLDATAESLVRQIFPNPEPFLLADAALAANLFNQTGRRSHFGRLHDCGGGDPLWCKAGNTQHVRLLTIRQTWLGAGVVSTLLQL